MHRPQYQKWSLQWEQGLGIRTSVSVGYFGHHGIHELVSNPNANAYGFGSLPAGQCGTPPVLPCSDPRFAGVTQWATRAISNYNGMVASFRHQFSGWGSGLVQVNYTYGHAFDEVSNGGVLSFHARQFIVTTRSLESAWRVWPCRVRRPPFDECQLRLGASGQVSVAGTWAECSAQRLASLRNIFCPHRFPLHGF